MVLYIPSPNYNANIIFMEAKQNIIPSGVMTNQLSYPFRQIIRWWIYKKIGQNKSHFLGLRDCDHNNQYISWHKKGKSQY